MRIDVLRYLQDKIAPILYCRSVAGRNSKTKNNSKKQIIGKDVPGSKP